MVTERDSSPRVVNTVAHTLSKVVQFVSSFVVLRGWVEVDLHRIVFQECVIPPRGIRAALRIQLGGV